MKCETTGNNMVMYPYEREQHKPPFDKAIADRFKRCSLKGIHKCNRSKNFLKIEVPAIAISSFEEFAQSEVQ
jgi:hypothetical protein